MIGALKWRPEHIIFYSSLKHSELENWSHYLAVCEQNSYLSHTHNIIPVQKISGFGTFSLSADLQVMQ